MILPQERQLGAAAKSGWSDALHVHLRGVLEVDKEGLVVSSRAEMAEVKSEMEDVVVVVPPRDGEDETLWPWFFLWACLDRTLGRYSEIRLPEADGGGRFEAPTILGRGLLQLCRTTVGAYLLRSVQSRDDGDVCSSLVLTLTVMTQRYRDIVTSDLPTLWH
jgi:hypothetical protein